MSSRIHIGTSGWSYQYWKENFYPEELKPSQWLHYYSNYFSTVEVNTTFYHLPLVSTIANWVKQVPQEFLFSLKASRYITHQKRLKECKNSLEIFYKVIEGLKTKTGPILFQLPPSFAKNQERLSEFIDLLHDNYQYAIEFRNPSWFVDEIYSLLQKKKIALCITDLNGVLSPEEITSSFTYIRLHGPQMAYQGSYSLKNLKIWKKKIEKWSTQFAVFCYFDNDEKGYAIQDAKTLKELIFR